MKFISSLVYAMKLNLEKQINSLGISFWVLGISMVQRQFCDFKYDISKQTNHELTRNEVYKFISLCYETKCRKTNQQINK